MTTRAVTRLCLLLATAFTISCRRGDAPRQALEQYFGSAMRGDYSATYRWYDDAYHAKVSRDDFVRHRREASVLQAFEILSLDADRDSGHATVRLTFAPSERLARTAAVTTTVREDLVRQRDGWRVRVW